jgi:hypothetical protein
MNQELAQPPDGCHSKTSDYPQPYIDIPVENERRYAEQMLGRFEDLLRNTGTHAEFVERSWDDDIASREVIEEYIGVLNELEELRQRKARVEDELGWADCNEAPLHARFSLADSLEEIESEIHSHEEYARRWNWTDYQETLERAERKYRKTAAVTCARAQVARMRARVKPICAIRINRHVRAHRPVRVAAKKTVAKAAADPDGPPSSRVPRSSAGGAL